MPIDIAQFWVFGFQLSKRAGDPFGVGEVLEPERHIYAGLAKDPSNKNRPFLCKQ
jgi:hypothetical protein